MTIKQIKQTLGRVGLSVGLSVNYIKTDCGLSRFYIVCENDGTAIFSFMHPKTVTKATIKHVKKCHNQYNNEYNTRMREIVKRTSKEGK